MESYDSFADQYDYLMKDVSYEDWTDYLCSFFSEAGMDVEKITDIGCGTGRITALLAGRGYSVTGIDRSEQMLMIASERAREDGLKIQFSCQDLEGLSIGRGDVITMNMDVMNYVPKEKTKGIFSVLHSSLKRGGLLLFDISSSYKLREVLGNNFFYEDHDDVTYFWKNSMREDCSGIDMELNFFVRKDGVYERRDEFQTQYIHEEKDIMAALEETGFDAICYDFGTRNSAGADSERLFFRCRKVN